MGQGAGERVGAHRASLRCPVAGAVPRRARTRPLLRGPRRVVPILLHAQASGLVLLRIFQSGRGPLADVPRHLLPGRRTDSRPGSRGCPRARQRSAGLTLVLASTSPRRYQILSLLRLPFLMVSPAVPEVASALHSPVQDARSHAQSKAAALAARFPDAVLIGSDTLISLDGAKIGKPRDMDDARDILRRLRGRAHEVVTAVAMIRGGRMVEAVETAQVRMRAFGEQDLETYLATGDSLDKAGAYSVQGPGRSLIAGLEGDYLAVMGLPLRAVGTGLRELGCPVAVDVDRIYRLREFLNWRTFS
ncbi:MAG: septum formation protein Maf [Nitrospirae bacterium]|nr:MAG: septum formation protein Maf [Nitrospirota bacterium]